MSNGMAQDNSREWGSLLWFSSHFSRGDIKDPTSYFSHSINGYQLFRHEVICEFLKSEIQIKKIESLLDIGCGTGVLTDKLASTCSPSDITGIDFLEKAIEQAKLSYPSFNFRTHSLPKLNFRDSTFDLIVVSEVLYYLDEEERNDAVAEIYRVLKSNGVMLFTSRLGSRYFSDNSATELIGSLFDIGNKRYINNLFYEFLMKPFRDLRLFCESRNEAVASAHPKHAILAQRFSWLADSSLLKYIYRASTCIERFLLRSTVFPKLCNSICQIVAPKSTRSSLILVARKDNK